MTLTRVKSVVMTSLACAKRSVPSALAAATRPTTWLSSLTTTATPCARFGIRLRVSPTVVSGCTVTAVSKTGCEFFTLVIDFATTSVGMSCGKIARPPRRAMVSAIRLPDTAVMFAATSGSGVANPSVEVRSTSNLLATLDRFGTRNTSE